MKKVTALQNIRTTNCLSQSQLSKLSGVNLRTLQDFEQGRKPLKNAKGEMLYRLSIALNCSINDLLADSIIDIEVNNVASTNHLEEYYKSIVSNALYDKYYSFPVIVPDSKVNMKRVYPTKQEVIYQLHCKLSRDERITSIVLFGSSITMQCHQKSDIDLAIRLDESCTNTDTKNSVSEIVQEICDWNADVIWYDRIDKSDRIYHDICKGVQIV